MNEMILLKLGELVLKGLNRRSFEDKLQANIYRRLNNLGQFRVYTRQSTTYVEPMNDQCDMDGAWEAMKKVFGVVGLSRARACDKDKDAILRAFGLPPGTTWTTNCPPPGHLRWRPSGPTRPSP
mgnify:CR=1 FL=1